MASLRSRLEEATIEGSVSLLLELLRQDPLLLDRVNLNELSETPLHIATLLGHVDFVHEILRRKPRLVRELDSQRSSPLHFAATKGHLEIVRDLIHVDADMCFVCNEDGRNPIHLAAMKGRIDVLVELIRARPLAGRTLVDQGGTILHLCVKNNQLEALRILIEHINDDTFINAKDDYGFTILHLAVSNKQIETVQYLVNDTRIQINALNSNGFTALDILSQSHRDFKDLNITESLQAAGASRTNTNITSSTSINRNQRPQTAPPRFYVLNQNYRHENETWLLRKRETLMVVASLIATMAFQAGINPPGGVWQDDTASQNPNQPAGTSIMAGKNKDLYSRYLSLNTTSFFSSLSIILMLITGLPFKHPIFMWILIAAMLIALTSIGLTYGVSIKFFTPNDSQSLISLISIYVAIAICGVVGLLLLGKIIQLLSGLSHKFYSFLWRKRQLPTH